MIFIDFSLIFNDFQRFSMVFNDFQWFSLIFHWFSLIFHEFGVQMLLWWGFKAKSRALHLARGLARGGQKSNISFDLLQNMMVRGGGPKQSGPYPTQLPFKTSVSLLRTQCCPRWRRCMAGWLAGWLAGLAGWLGRLGWLVGWVVGLAGWLGCRVCWLAGLSGWRVGGLAGWLGCGVGGLAR